MRGALIRWIGVAVLALVLLASGRAEAGPPRPVVRIVFSGGADPPSWFDGFAAHMQSELALRGIDVAVARASGDAGPRSPGESSAAAAGADAELVVDAPSALRPVLRFSVAPGAGGSSDAGSGGHVRQVNLNRVPSDGRALALAVAADELMRSTWPRAVPAERGSSPAEEGDAKARENEGGKGTNDQENARNAGKKGAVAASDADDGGGADAASPGDSSEAAAGRRSPSPKRSAIGVAAALEAFTAGQTQIGADVRWAVYLLPRLDLELRVGFRSIARRETTHGSVDGSAIVGGGALAFHIVDGSLASLLVVGRAELWRASYAGQARDSTVDANAGAALGFVVGAGPRGRLMVTRSLALDGEVLAGVSPMATTANDAGSSVVSTNGAALMTSLGLSLGL
jgi:hypothetical protein